MSESSSTFQDKKKFKPSVRFNVSNRVITAKEVENIINSIFQKMNEKPWRKEKIQPISIDNPKIFIEAFTHSSYILEMRELERTNGMRYSIPESDYEVMEFLGDALLTFLIDNILVSNFPNESEHFYTQMKIQLIKKKTYADFSRYLGFDKYVLISSYLESSKDQGRRGDSMLEDVFEAFFGALLKHFGLLKGTEIANNIIVGIFEERINFTKIITSQDNFKDCVIQYFRSQNWGTQPDFEELYHHGPPNDRTFGIILKLQKNFIAELPKKQIEKIKKYNKTLVEKIPPEQMSEEIRQRISEINNSEFEIIGFGVERAKKKGQQAASQDALDILDVDVNLILLNGAGSKKR